MAEIVATPGEPVDTSMVGCRFEIGHNDLRRAFALVRGPAEAGELEWRLVSGRLTLVGHAERMTCEIDVDWRQAPSGLPSDCVVLSCDVAVLADSLCGRAFLDRRGMNNAGDPGLYSVKFTCIEEVPCALDESDQADAYRQVWGIAIGSNHYIECAFLRKRHSMPDAWLASGDIVQTKQLGRILSDLLSFARSGRGGEEGAIRVTQDRAYAFNMEPTTRQRLVRAPHISPMAFRIAQREAGQLAEVLKQLWGAETRLYRQGTALIFSDDRSRCRVEAPELVKPPIDGPPLSPGVRVDADKLFLAIERARDQVPGPMPIYLQLDVPAPGEGPTRATLKIEIGLPDGEYAQATCSGWLIPGFGNPISPHTNPTDPITWRVSSSGEDLGRLRVGCRSQLVDVHLTSSTVCFMWEDDALSVRTEVVLERLN